MASLETLLRYILTAGISSSLHMEEDFHIFLGSRVAHFFLSIKSRILVCPTDFVWRRGGVWRVRVWQGRWQMHRGVCRIFCNIKESSRTTGEAIMHRSVARSSLFWSIYLILNSLTTFLYSQNPNRTVALDSQQTCTYVLLSTYLIIILDIPLSLSSEELLRLPYTSTFCSRYLLKN